MAKFALCGKSGEGRTRTGDTPVFSRVLYQLSYLAAAAASLAGLVRGADGAQSLDEAVDEVALHQDGIRAGLAHRLVQLGRRVAGERDEAEIRMILPEPRHRGDAVDDRHVQVDDDRVRVELVGQLDRVEPVIGCPGNRQDRLMLDEWEERREETLIVVHEEDAYRYRNRAVRLVHGADVSLAAMSVQPAQREIALIGAPLDLGAGRRGVDMGPSAIRYAELEQHLQQALGIRTVDLGNVDAPVAESTDTGDESARFLPQILALCDQVAQLVMGARSKGQTPLVLGGDHSVALGSLVGMANVHGPGGVLWVDAHGDLNTPESSPSGNVHGMVLAAALGLGGDAFARPGWTLPAIRAGRLSLFGVRSLDQGERELLKQIDAKVFTMADVDRIGVERCMREAIAHASGANFFHVSIDLDAVDPETAPGVGTPVRGGLSYREAHLAMEVVAESAQADSFDIVEVNPVLDRENATGKLAVELMASALGARIL